MEIQTKAMIKLRTPRVKCITGHPGYPDILVCLFTGEIRIYDHNTFSLKKSAQLCEVPIRTAVIVPSKDCILVGNDEGCILVVDLGNLSILETVKAHDDFIRKIVVDEHNKRIITVSDDNRTKLWSFSDGIVMINKYKDSKHFVMDACFYPSDNSQFFTVSLDKKIRMYSIASNEMLKAFKGHEKGVNSIAFINPETFVTGSDDCSLMVWNVRRPLPIAVLRGHTKNVNKIRALRNGFASCSEDNTVRFWNNEFKTVEVISMQGRVWDLYPIDDKIFVGSDEELCVFQELNVMPTTILKENKIFYNFGTTIYFVKTDDLGAYKELGAIEESFESFTVNSNGKLIAIEGKLEIGVYSALGMRKKYSDRGKNLFFIDTDRLVYLKDTELIFVMRNEIEMKQKVPGIRKLLYADEKWAIVNTGKTGVYSIGESFGLLHEFDIIAKRSIAIGQFFILFNDQIHIYNKNFDEIETLIYTVEHFIIHNDVLFFSTSSKSFYLLFDLEKCHLFNMKYYGQIIGIRDDNIFYYHDGIKTGTIGMQFINFKQSYFKGLNPKVGDDFKDKAIAFFELLGLYEKALALCSDENQKFEILIKLNRLEDALKSANSPIKYEKLGKKFISIGEFSRASECFLKSNDIDSLLLADLFGDKKHLGYVAEKAKESGRNNLAFLASYKEGNYKRCGELLRGSPFGHVFDQFYLN